MIGANKHVIRDNFDYGAATYDCYAVVQKEMAKDLVCHLVNIESPVNRILDIGCGTGYLTGLLAEVYPHAGIVALDIAPKMIDAARNNLSAYKTIEYITADGEMPPVDGAFDLIVSNATFQWFTGYRKPFEIYYQLLAPGGHLVFNMLGERTLEELQRALSLLGNKGREAETASNMASEEVILEALDMAGFEDTAVSDYLLRENYPSARHLIMAIKKIGAGGFAGHGSLRHGIGAEIFKLSSLYEKHFSDTHGIFATYHCLLACGKKVK